MSSQDVQKLKAHFLTSQQWEGKSNPAADELWFVKMPHWLKYGGSGCLSITTQPTASGNEINFYAGASFVVHCGKYADGTNNNRIVEITSDKYLTVSDSGSYCFDESGNMVYGSSITYDASTNTVEVDGISGNYSQPIQSFTYDSGMNEVTLDGTVSVKGLGGGGSGELIQSGSNWGLKFGNTVIQFCQGTLNYGEYSTTIYLPIPMKDTSYATSLLCGSYYQPYIGSKYTTSIEVNISDNWDTVNFVVVVAGECA